VGITTAARPRFIELHEGCAKIERETEDPSVRVVTIEDSSGLPERFARLRRPPCGPLRS